MANATRGKKPAAKQATRGRTATTKKPAPKAAKPTPKRGAPAKRGAAKPAARGGKQVVKKPAPKAAPKQAPKAAPKQAPKRAPKAKSNLFDINVWLNDGFRTFKPLSSEQQDLGLNVTYKDQTGAEKTELILFTRLVSFSESAVIVKDRVLVDFYEDVTFDGEGNFIDVTTEDGATATIYRQPDYTIEIVPAGFGAARGGVDAEDEEEAEGGDSEEYSEEEYEEEGEGGEDGEYSEEEYEEEGDEDGEYSEEGEDGEYSEEEYEEGEDGEYSEEGEDGEDDGFTEDYEDYEE